MASPKKLSQRLEGTSNLCVHSVMISALFLNFHVPTAWWHFSTGKEGLQSWHSELNAIMVLVLKRLRPEEQTLPSQSS